MPYDWKYNVINKISSELLVRLKWLELKYIFVDKNKS